MAPTLGRIVLYRLGPDDADQVLRQRESRGSPYWLPGNPVRAGQEFPAIVVDVCVDESLNLQVFLDGEDVLWVTSRCEGDGDGTWHRRVTEPRSG